MERCELVVQSWMSRRNDVVIHIAVGIANMACSANACSYEEIFVWRQSDGRIRGIVPWQPIVIAAPILGSSMTVRTADALRIEDTVVQFAVV